MSNGDKDEKSGKVTAIPLSAILRVEFKARQDKPAEVVKMSEDEEQKEENASPHKRSGSLTRALGQMRKTVSSATK